MDVMTFDETLAEARQRKADDREDEYHKAVEYWLSRLRPPVSVESKPMREFSERDAICRACPHVSKSMKWCCVDEVNPEAISQMSAPPKDCPYAVELIVLGGEAS